MVVLKHKLFSLSNWYIHSHNTFKEVAYNLKLLICRNQVRIKGTEIMHKQTENSNAFIRTQTSSNKKNANGFNEELRISHSTVSHPKYYSLHYFSNRTPSFEKDQFSFLFYQLTKLQSTRDILSGKSNYDKFIFQLAM